MKRKWLMLWAAGLVLSAVAQEPAPGTTPVRVRGSRVNLRAKPAKDAEPLGQVTDGTVLTAKSFRDDWVEIVPPDQVSLWVHKDFIKDQAVSAEKLYVRTGPNINHAMVGTMLRGERLIVRGQAQDWVRIAPPPSASLWVSRALVEVLPGEKQPPLAADKAPPSPAIAAPAPVPTPVPAPVPVPVAPAVTALTAAVGTPVVTTVETTATNEVVPRDLNLVPLAGQGRVTQREGVLRLVGFGFHHPSRYRLVKLDGRHIETLCYVRGNSSQLSALLDQSLLIRGREYWVSGSEYSLLIPDRITPRAGP